MTDLGLDPSELIPDAPPRDGALRKVKAAIDPDGGVSPSLLAMLKEDKSV